ncbi:hypothetical protein [Pseudomonas tohonis]|uniref:hypothetical protein n=1 Tax=Pseudomonas tohonis TaxID=2725477 RepID=UPI00255C0D0C|nr:hypothetical protein [Pseudomonas tohonis]
MSARIALAGLALSLAPLLAIAEEGTARGSCISAEVNGYKALSYDCLTQRLANPQGAEAARRNQAATQVPIEHRPANRLGLATPAATHVRMGANFGQSVLPQRPAP